MAEVHYSDSEPILPHEEMADELEEIACDLDDDIVLSNDSVGDEQNSSVGFCLDKDVNRDELTSIRTNEPVTDLQSHDHLSDYGASPHSNGNINGTLSASLKENNIQEEIISEIVQQPEDSLLSESIPSSSERAVSSEIPNLLKPAPVNTRTSNISEASSGSASFNYEDERVRALSIPLHATMLAPQASAIFYDRVNSDLRGVPINKQVVVVDDGRFQSNPPSSLGSTNEMRNFANSVGGDSTMDLDAVEKANQWHLNYQEASIYLEEGANNDKFDTHPRDQSSLPAYQMVHNDVFYCVEITVAVLLMGLAFLEKPSVFKKQMDPFVHGILEIIFLLIISLESVMKMRWMGFDVFIRHRRSMLKVVVLCVVFIEALVVICRGENHLRFTRALRPIFFMDCRYARGVRRFVRQILLSLPPVIEMCILLLFFNFIFAILGNSLFLGSDKFFGNLRTSIVSLFVLFSSANYPDVMMKNYADTPASFFFFLAYLLITLYIIMNLLLAVVVNSFSDNELQKLKGLLLHRREACRMAFKLLNSKSNINHVSIKHFAGLMRYFSPNKTTENVYLCFKVLNKSETGHLTVDEFMNVYEVSELKWKERKGDTGPWFNHVTIIPLRRCGEAVNRLVRLNVFKYIVFVVLIGNAVVKALADIFDKENPDLLKQVEYGFLAFYIMEASLKIFGLGPTKYFKSSWNSFDFAITILASCLFIFDQVNLSRFVVKDWTEGVKSVINVLRPLRLLRLFKYRKRYRDVFSTVFVLLPRMSSVGTVLLLLYYFYAIIGMEIFYPSASKENLINCCNETTVAESYLNNTGFYYVNNFDNILRSMVTLFELTVVNNWFIIMEGFASVTKNEWTRIFFMSFYLMTMVVMNIVIAFMLEAFTFRIDYRKTTEKDMDEDAMVKVTMSLTGKELRMVKATEDTYEDWKKAVKVAKGIKSLERPPPPLADALHGNFIANKKMQRMNNGAASSSYGSASTPIQINTDDSLMNGVNFRATRSRKKVDFSIKIYADQVEQWFKESDEKNLQDEGTPLLTTSQWSRNTQKTRSEGEDEES